MNIRPHDYTAPNLPQYRPIVNPLESDPGFFAELGAGFERNTAVAAIHWLSQGEFAPDPDFDFETRAKASELYARHPDAFLDVRSEREFTQMEARVARADEADRVLAAGGGSAFVAGLMAGVIDPVNLLPGGVIYKGFKTANVMRTVLSTTAAGALAGGVNEAVLQADIPQRTAQEGLISIGASALLSGILGGTLGVVLRGADRQALGRVASDMVSDTPSMTRYQPDTPMGSMGAAINPDAAFENLPQVGELAPAFGVERYLTKINPIGRVLTDPHSGTARSLQASLDTGGMAFEGVANIGGDIESLAKAHYNLLAKAVLKRNEIMGGNRITRLGGVTKFNEQVAFALRRGAVHDDPGIQSYAQFLRAEFFEPLRREAQAVGFKEFQDLEQEYIDKYVNRVARRSLIARDYDEFQNILEEHFTEKLTSIWASRVEKTEGRAARLNDTADLLELDEAGAREARAATEAQIAALPSQFDAQVRDAAERVRQLREDAKGATREEAKKLRAEAKAIEKSNKKLLADFTKQERALKNRFRLLGHTGSGIAGKNRQIVERVQATLAAADKSREILLRKLNKLARGYEELSEEARDAAIEDAVEQLGRMKELELKALEKTRGEAEQLKREAPPVESVNSALDAVELPPDIEEALAKFVAIDVRKGVAMGIMDATPLESIVRNPASPEYKQLYASGAPVRELLKSTVGDYVTLFRRQLPVDQSVSKGSAPQDGQRAVLSWTYDKSVAEDFAGVNKPAKLYSEDEIVAAMEQYRTFGEAKVGKYRFVREDDGMQMYQGRENITGFYDKPEELRAWMEGENKDAQEANARNDEKRGSIIEARVPVDSIITGTHRGLQSELLVRNDPSSPVYIDPTGKAVIKSVPEQADPIAAATAKFDEAEAEFRELRDLDPAMVAERIESIQLELIEQAEGLAARRREYVDSLVGRLRNPNEAKAEAASLRTRGQNVWFDLLKRAADAKVGLERGKPADISGLAKHYADTVASSYLGESARLPFFNIVGGERGSEIARMLDIDETRTWSNGRRFEEFLENDIEMVMGRYLRTMAPDIELMRKFGTVNPLAKDSPFMQKIEGEYRDARDVASKIEDPDKRNKALEKIAAKREATIRDLTTSLRRIRNTDGIPENPHGFANRAGRALLNLNTSRLMGKMVIASVSDLAMLMARHGPGRFMKDGVVPLVSNWKQMRLSLEEAQLAGTALDMVLHGRASAFADVFDDLRMGTGAERGLQFMANNIGFISGMDLWNQNMKRVASSISIARTTRALERVAEGTAKKDDLFHLNRLGIDEVLGRDIWEAMQDGSTVVEGIRMPNTEDWGRAAFAAGDMEKYNRALNAKRAFRAALARDIDDTIVTPGGEIPAWMTASMTGRLIGQFRRFAFSSTMKVLVAGLQAARVQGKASGSIMALSSVPFFLASGMLSYYLWATVTGGKAWDEMQNADAEKWLTEGTLRGLPLGVFSEVPKFSEELFGITGGREASNFSSNPMELLGPSVGAITDTGRALSGIKDAITGQDNGLSASEAGAIKRLLPYNNLWVWDSILRPTFEGIAQ